MREIAAWLGLNKPLVSTRVEGLVEAGLVHRNKAPADRRLVRLTLTMTGEGLLQRTGKGEPRSRPSLLA